MTTTTDQIKEGAVVHPTTAERDTNTNRWVDNIRDYKHPNGRTYALRDALYFCLKKDHTVRCTLTPNNYFRDEATGDHYRTPSGWLHFHIVRLGGSATASGGWSRVLAVFDDGEKILSKHFHVYSRGNSCQQQQQNSIQQQRSGQKRPHVEKVGKEEEEGQGTNRSEGERVKGVEQQQATSTDDACVLCFNVREQTATVRLGGLHTSSIPVCNGCAAVIASLGESVSIFDAVSERPVPQVVLPRLCAYLMKDADPTRRPWQDYQSYSTEHREDLLRSIMASIEVPISDKVRDLLVAYANEPRRQRILALGNRVHGLQPRITDAYKRLKKAEQERDRLSAVLAAETRAHDRFAEEERNAQREIGMLYDAMNAVESAAQHQIRAIHKVIPSV